MPRYIDAAKVMEELSKIRSISAKSTPNEIFSMGISRGIDRAETVIEMQPTADVVEVRHGTWYHGTEHGAVYAKCSACGRKMNYSCYGYAYCALCGAKMDGGAI